MVPCCCPELHACCEGFTLPNTLFLSASCISACEDCHLSISIPIVKVNPTAWVSAEDSQGRVWGMSCGNQFREDGSIGFGMGWSCSFIAGGFIAGLLFDGPITCSPIHYSQVFKRTTGNDGNFPFPNSFNANGLCLPGVVNSHVNQPSLFLVSITE